MSSPLMDIDILTPPGWLGVDLDAAPQESEVRRRVDERVATQPSLAAHRDELVGVVMRAARSARERGVIIAAVMVGADGDAPTVAALNVARTQVADDALRTLLAGPDGEGRRRVQLRAGAALRVKRTHEAKLFEHGEDVLAFSVQYFVPVPPTDSLLAVSFVSPSMSERAELEELFELIAGTLNVELPAPASAAAAAR